MPRLGPISRRELIEGLNALGFDGPFAGGSHAFMIKDKIRLTLPNPHKKDIGIDLLSKILKQGGISKEEWTLIRNK